MLKINTHVLFVQFTWITLDGTNNSQWVMQSFNYIKGREYVLMLNNLNLNPLKLLPTNCVF